MGIHQGFVLRPQVFAIVIAAVMKYPGKDLMNEKRWADDFILLIVSIKNFGAKF